MLPIDHLPFPAPDVDALGAAFERLGFSVTPPCVYASPEGGRWRNRAVVFDHGWFDLLQEPQALSGEAAPFACLFLTDDLDAATGALTPLKTSETFRLERRIDGAAATESFRYRNLHGRIAPLFLAVIEHAWPCPDIEPRWRDHPNSAYAIQGVTFGDAEPGPRAAACGQVLDLSGFGYLPAQAFAERYGSPRRPIAVRLRVRSLERAAQALGEHSVPFEAGETLVVRGPEGFGCSFEFSAA